jgi:hypothetical protein
LTWLLFVVYAIQSDLLIFLRVQAPVLSALHPVFALFDFYLGFILAQSFKTTPGEKSEMKVSG